MLFLDMFSMETIEIQHMAMIFSHTFQLIRMAIDVVLKQLKMHIFILI